MIRLQDSITLTEKMHYREQFSRTASEYSAMFTFHMQIRSAANTLS